MGSYVTLTPQAKMYLVVKYIWFFFLFGKKIYLWLTFQGMLIFWSLIVS